MNPNVFRNLSYGVYMISAYDQRNLRYTGCIANSAMQITSSPATIAISVNHDNYTNSCIMQSGKFTLSILSEESDPGIIGTFGFRSGRDSDKFSGVPHSIKDGGAVLNDCCGYLTCKVINTMETDTHTVFLGLVEDGEPIGSQAPMTYSYYHKVIKGKSPKNAPTYLPEEKDNGKVWTCSVCGYKYDGDVPFEDLPDSYTCPVCGVPKSKFELR